MSSISSQLQNREGSVIRLKRAAELIPMYTPVDDFASTGGHVCPAAAATLPQAFLDYGRGLVDASLHAAL